MLRSKRSRLLLTFASVLFLLVVAVTPALAAVFQDVTYTYDSSAQTFTIYATTGMYGAPIALNSATLRVDGGAVRTDAACTTGSSGLYPTPYAQCVFSGVNATSKIASSATVVLSPSGWNYSTYTGKFAVSCKGVATKGCSGTKSVRLVGR